MRKLTCFIAAVSIVFASFAQVSLHTPRSIAIQKTTESIKIDGILNEPAWQVAATAGNFMQHFPSDTALAKSQTEAKVCFDDTYLYISAVCYQPQKYTIQTLKRDYGNGTSDLFFVNIDPFGDHLNGFYFAINPYGIQKEAQLYNGNELNIDWDCKWVCAAKTYPTYWTAEMAIPFKSLRYKVLPGQNTWSINFARNNLTEFERSTWVPIGRNMRMIDINFTGSMVWPVAPPKTASNVAIIPYVLSSVDENYLAKAPDPTGVQTKFNTGLDAKIAVTPSMNLDVTVNPDFAQVDVDQQVTDLSRFEIFFPERRQFFIENSDLFGSFASGDMNPFFSRRIGIINNSKTGRSERIPILAGMRLSGRLNNDWRVGLLNMQTAAYKKDSLPSTNYLVAAIQRRVFKRSNIAAIFVNKEGFVDKNTKEGYSKYNRVAGLEFNYASESGAWVAKAFANHSFSPVKKGDEGTYGLEMGYVDNRFLISPGFYYIGKNYNAEAGFVPRTGVYQHPMTINWYLYPKKKLGNLVNNISIGPDYFVTYDNFEKRFTDWDAGIYSRVRFQNSAELSTALVRWDYTWLFENFDPTNKYKHGFEVLKAGTAYTYRSHRIAFKTDTRKLFTADMRLRFGQYFNGKIQSAQTILAYRWQPYGIFSLDATYTRIRLPKGYNQADFLVIGPKAEITFSKNIFWTTFFQYNNQVNNFNINSRLQWRFKPLSDLFIVYTDNYFATDALSEDIRAFGKKNKALVIKFNYWLNL